MRCRDPKRQRVAGNLQANVALVSSHDSRTACEGVAAALHVSQHTGHAASQYVARISDLFAGRRESASRGSDAVAHTTVHNFNGVVSPLASLPSLELGDAVADVADEAEMRAVMAIQELEDAFCSRYAGQPAKAACAALQLAQLSMPVTPGALHRRGAACDEVERNATSVSGVNAIGAALAVSSSPAARTPTAVVLAAIVAMERSVLSRAAPASVAKALRSTRKMRETRGSAPSAAVSPLVGQRLELGVAQSPTVASPSRHRTAWQSEAPAQICAVHVAAGNESGASTRDVRAAGRRTVQGQALDLDVDIADYFASNPAGFELLDVVEAAAATHYEAATSALSHGAQHSTSRQDSTAVVTRAQEDQRSPEIAPPFAGKADGERDFPLLDAEAAARVASLTAETALQVVRKHIGAAIASLESAQKQAGPCGIHNAVSYATVAPSSQPMELPMQQLSGAEGENSASVAFCKTAEVAPRSYAAHSTALAAAANDFYIDSDDENGTFGDFAALSRAEEAALAQRATSSESTAPVGSPTNPGDRSTPVLTKAQCIGDIHEAGQLNTLLSAVHPAAPAAPTDFAIDKFDEGIDDLLFRAVDAAEATFTQRAIPFAAVAASAEASSSCAWRSVVSVTARDARAILGAFAMPHDRPMASSSLTGGHEASSATTVFLRCLVTAVSTQHEVPSHRTAPASSEEPHRHVAGNPTPALVSQVVLRVAFLDGSEVTGNAQPALRAGFIVVRGVFAEDAERLAGAVVHVVAVMRGRPVSSAALRSDDVYLSLLGSVPAGTIVPSQLLVGVSAASQCRAFLVDDNNNALVVHPDVLLAPTSIGKAIDCLRLAVLGEILPDAGGSATPTGSSGSRRALLYGTLKHKLFEAALKTVATAHANAAASGAGQCTDESSEDESLARLPPLTLTTLRAYLHTCAHAIVHTPSNMVDLYAIGESDKSALDELGGVVDGIVDWVTRFIGAPGDKLSNEPTSPLQVVRVVCTEADIWSPIWGLKGKVDAVMDVSIQPADTAEAKGGRNVAHEAANVYVAQPVAARSYRRIPFELKTGRAPSGPSAVRLEYRMQVAVYALLMDERYGSCTTNDSAARIAFSRGCDERSSPIPASSAVRLDLGPFAQSKNVEDVGGLLTYLAPPAGIKAEAVDKFAMHSSYVLPAQWQERRSMLCLRNRLAAALMRARTSACRPDDYHNGFRASIKSSRARLEDSATRSLHDLHLSPPLLPPLAQDKYMCGRCFAFTACAAVYAAHELPIANARSERKAATTGAHDANRCGKASAVVADVADHAEGCCDNDAIPTINDMSAPVAELYSAALAHLNPTTTAYLRKWLRLVDIESTFSKAPPRSRENSRAQLPADSSPTHENELPYVTHLHQQPTVSLGMTTAEPAERLSAESIPLLSAVLPIKQVMADIEDMASLLPPQQTAGKPPDVKLSLSMRDSAHWLDNKAAIWLQSSAERAFDGCAAGRLVLVAQERIAWTKLRTAATFGAVGADVQLEGITTPLDESAASDLLHADGATPLHDQFEYTFELADVVHMSLVGVNISPGDFVIVSRDAYAVVSDTAPQRSNHHSGGPFALLKGYVTAKSATRIVLRCEHDLRATCPEAFIARHSRGTFRHCVLGSRKWLWRVDRSESDVITRMEKDNIIRLVMGPTIEWDDDAGSTYDCADNNDAVDVQRCNSDALCMCIVPKQQLQRHTVPANVVAKCAAFDPFRIDEDDAAALFSVADTAPATHHAVAMVGPVVSTTIASTAPRGDVKRRRLIIELEAPRFAHSPLYPWTNLDTPKSAGTHPAEGPQDRKANIAGRVCVLPAPASRWPIGDETTNAALRAEFYDKLNDDQRGAITRILSARDYVCLLGMPGTGKTSTIAFLVRVLAALGRSVLLTSFTHTAVDTLLLKLVDDSSVLNTGPSPQRETFDILRLGEPRKVHPAIRRYCLSALIEGGILTSVAEISRHLAAVPIVGVTCLGLSHPALRERRFDVCIVDEASQLKESVALGPLRSSRVFVLVGDHLQLPPLVRSPVAKASGLDVSLFRRLSEAHSGAVAALTYQYRMNEDIQSLANELVYAHALRCGSSAVASGRYHLPLLSTMRHPPGADGWLPAVLDPATTVMFLDTDALCDRSFECNEGPAGGTGALTNPAEATIVSTIIAGILAAGGNATDIGVIAPYHAQLRLLRASIDATVGAVGAAVEIETVDRYQGRDKPVIILSMTRSNTTRESSALLSDKRRLNVALTRAKYKLIFVGSAVTTSSSADDASCLSRLMSLLRSRGWTRSLTSNTLFAQAPAPLPPSQ